MSNSGHSIITHFDFSPIPDRSMDWSAVLRDYDGAPDSRGPTSFIGRGPTELTAIADLLQQIEEYGVLPPARRRTSKWKDGERWRWLFVINAGWLKVKVIRDEKVGGVSYHTPVLEREDDESLILVVQLWKEYR